MDLSIHGDDERDRLRMEHELRDISIQLTSDSSVEYPRHMDGYQHHHQSFHSLYDEDEDDDLGQPHTVSTANHHASAISLTAGLGQGAARNRSAVSGGEYDPDRSIRRLVAARPEISLFNSSHLDIDTLRLSDPPDSPAIATPRQAPRTLDRAFGSLHKRPRSASPASIQRKIPHQSALKQSAASRTPFNNIGNRLDSRGVSVAEHVPPKATRRQVHLPDVTGLTSAVVSPEKGRDGYPSVGKQSSFSLRRIMTETLDSLSRKLDSLQKENSTSRRRVHELERELEACKQDVTRERSRIMEREGADNRSTKGKQRVDLDEERYWRVVEEKKSLEALLDGLRARISDVTHTLSAHQSALDELARLRSVDAREAENQLGAIEGLRGEVDWLGAEVARLRSVIEDGLEERREMSRRRLEESGMDSIADQEDQEDLQLDQLMTAEDEDDEPPRRAAQPARRADRTARTDGATMATSTSSRFIEDSELAQVSEELEERRSQRSSSSSSSNRSVMSYHHSWSAAVEQSELRGEGASRPQSRQSQPASQRDSPPPEAFPRIHGARLETLFRTVPEHNAGTCGVCNNRRLADTRLPHNVRQGGPNQPRSGMDRGFGRQEHRTPHHTNTRRPASSKQRTSVHKEDEQLPQAVLVGVIRTLEDDFSHYKAIYIELSHQYEVMNGASHKAKRNILAQHLREVIDTLEGKGDQIADLYELLSIKDQNAADSAVALALAAQRRTTLA